MDDNDVVALELELANGDARNITDPGTQRLILDAINTLDYQIKSLLIERVFGELLGDAAKFQVRREELDDLQAKLQRRRDELSDRLELPAQSLLNTFMHVREEGWRSPASGILGLEPTPKFRSESGSRRLTPIQVRITRQQEAALEIAKAVSGRTVSQLLRDALGADRIREKRHWDRTRSDDPLAVKRWVRCDQATVRTLRLVAQREGLTVSNVVRGLVDSGFGG